MVQMRAMEWMTGIRRWVGMENAIMFKGAQNEDITMLSWRALGMYLLMALLAGGGGRGGWKGKIWVQRGRGSWVKGGATIWRPCCRHYIDDDMQKPGWLVHPPSIRFGRYNSI